MKPAVKALSTIGAVALLATLSVSPAMAATPSIQTSGAVFAAPIVQEPTVITGITVSVPVDGAPAFVLGESNVYGTKEITSGSILAPRAPVVSGNFANLDPAIDYGYASYTIWESTTPTNGTTIPAGAVQLDSGTLKVASGAFSFTATTAPLLTSQTYLADAKPTFANGVVTYGEFNRYYTLALDWSGTAERAGFNASTPISSGTMHIPGGSVAPVSEPSANIPPVAPPMPSDPVVNQPGITAPVAPGSSAGPSITGPGSTGAGGTGTKASEANKGGSGSVAAPVTTQKATQPLIDTGVTETNDSPSSLFLALGLLGITGAAVTMGAIGVKQVAKKK